MKDKDSVKLTSEGYLDLIVRRGARIKAIQDEICNLRFEMERISAGSYPDNIGSYCNIAESYLSELKNRLCANLSYAAIEAAGTEKENKE